jgi:phosphinothricin acetyltransferase
VTSSTVTFDLVPRTLDEQLEWLEARSGAHAVLVADDDGEVVGFASLSPYRDRPAYSTTVEDSVYVASQARGRGVGRMLLEELVKLATQHGFHTIMARIVGGHEASIALHQSVGFEVVGTEREVGRKFGRWLDVVVMQRLL